MRILSIVILSFLSTALQAHPGPEHSHALTESDLLVRALGLVLLLGLTLVSVLRFHAKKNNEV